MKFLAHIAAAMQETGHMLSFNNLQQMHFTGGVIGRLLLAAVLGGVIGIDREYHHKPSGVRTNLLICFGAALFTFLSAIVAGEGSTNKGQIASNVVQGIGFLGAGLILHNRDRVSGLTSAATVWAVASIGMACGAGLYGPAVMSAVLVIVVLEVVGVLEREGNLKSYTVVYEARGVDAENMKLSLLASMDSEKRQLTSIEDESMGEIQRLSFSVTATSRVHKRLLASFKSAAPIAQVFTFRSQEDE
ncbi:putative Mg2+ transporter-C (MgtC) family protein [Silvibacterium bohemicum]|uniref:Putative Mg2+ transporter-C (MgtC) family protein n=1 Tax=Silvibacterium bohemicum TaxID=1577686 RepID=A0A841JMH2_9BACT|nr:MgtC/SapB family protein [Silvibacterium bohemicum]MBB6142433.1 putative Mg2+ transporter-C (MgtC) family protein [Silvibacterium bohemicum]